LNVRNDATVSARNTIKIAICAAANGGSDCVGPTLRHLPGIRCVNRHGEGDQRRGADDVGGKHVVHRKAESGDAREHRRRKKGGGERVETPCRQESADDRTPDAMPTKLITDAVPVPPSALRRILG
jgi:hypothetical protein